MVHSAVSTVATCSYWCQNVWPAILGQPLCDAGSGHWWLVEPGDCPAIKGRVGLHWQRRGNIEVWQGEPAWYFNGAWTGIV